MSMLDAVSDKSVGFRIPRGAVMIDIPSQSDTSASSASDRRSVHDTAGEALARRVQRAAGQFNHSWSLAGSRPVPAGAAGVPHPPERAACDTIRRRDETPSEMFIG